MKKSRYIYKVEIDIKMKTCNKVYKTVNIIRFSKIFQYLSFNISDFSRYLLLRKFNYLSNSFLFDMVYKTYDCFYWIFQSIGNTLLTLRKSLKTYECQNFEWTSLKSWKKYPSHCTVHQGRGLQFNMESENDAFTKTYAIKLPILLHCFAKSNLNT